MALWLSLPFIASVSVVLTEALRRYALARSLMDIPNGRSSHSMPTPRAGGLAIAFSFLMALPVFGFLGVLDWSFVFALLGAGAGISLLGWLDDYSHVPVRWRLLGHFSGAAWALFWLSGLPLLNVFDISLDLGWLGHILAAIYLVWMLNLYNFMDGIDGIAGVEAVTVCLCACLLYWVTGFQNLMWVPAMLAMATAGFLIWNFPPARIFMGDAGSGFLGMMFGVISIQAAWVSHQLFWAWLILLGVFIVDATFTLFRRLIRGDKVYEAHRSHAYQFAARRVHKHLPVTLAVGAINIAWLLPVALCVAFFGLDGALGLLIAYIPLLLLAVKFHAGELEEKQAISS
ncbi:glycosyl transferase WbpL [Pseudomonas mandelii JR-1]|uniref:Glycosyl transferase WbpL n=1 Tax=Pseudomonas mandelii JR-1 TaxID=1147786 RepID=A0A024E7A5_9PSED|nr:MULTISPECIES: glycosyltransferase family 4 protein [Pseudomonas]AHZ68779.1 glycosyl transferase WbpL [Pseudomonas mandelii JR-1]OYQ23099.1 glycosyl transferase [Pseudomonas mandelii]QQO00593.1 glycosyltransferase family 4 protein [Pseudomonas sp. SW-3]